jgi:hypothetical protein
MLLGSLDRPFPHLSLRLFVITKVLAGGFSWLCPFLGTQRKLAGLAFKSPWRGDQQKV